MFFQANQIEIRPGSAGCFHRGMVAMECKNCVKRACSFIRLGHLLEASLRTAFDTFGLSSLRCGIPLRCIVRASVTFSHPCLSKVCPLISSLRRCFGAVRLFGVSSHKIGLFIGSLTAHCVRHVRFRSYKREAVGSWTPPAVLWTSPLVPALQTTSSCRLLTGLTSNR